MAAQSLKNFLNMSLDVLRDNETLIGIDALKAISQLLILKLIEPLIGVEIDFDGFNGYNIEDDEEKAFLLRYVRFSNLSEVKEENTLPTMREIWYNILSVHPVTKSIFLHGKNFDITKGSTYKRLVKCLNKIDFTQIESDVQGDIYQDIIKNIMTGKTMGQFFTPPIMKDIMIELVNPQVHDDGTIETIFDPTMGTAGFLVSSMKHLKKQATEKGIVLDMNFIINKGLSGREIEHNAYQLACSNMLIFTSHVFNILTHGDAIRDPITNKYDIVLANPPFGIKGLNYNDISHPLKLEYLPIASKNAITLFLQVILYILKKDGRCAVVLPDGQDLYGRNESVLNVRKLLIKSCELQEVIHIPSGVFTNTSIKTCILYFIKRVNKLTSIMRVDRGGKTPIYQFNDDVTHTKNVKFYDFDIDTKQKVFLLDVQIEKLEANGYSLNYKEYVRIERVITSGDVTMMKLGDICDIEKGKIQATACDNGVTYKFITLAENKTHSTYSIDGENVFISHVNSGGNAGNYKTKIIYYNGKCEFASILLRLIIKININVKYLYNILHLFKTTIETYNKGAANQVLDWNRAKQLQIPVPPLERQRELVEQLDTLQDCINANKKVIANMQKLNKICIDRKCGNNMMKLGDICEFQNGKFNSGDMNNAGNIPFYNCSSRNPVGYHDTYSFDYLEYLLLILTGGSQNNLSGDNVGLGTVYYVSGKTACRAGVTSMLFNNNIIYTKYAYYYIKSNKCLISGLANFTTNLGVIKRDNLATLQIPVPPLERQREIVDYCDKTNTRIEELYAEIKEYEDLQKQIITEL